ncbi:MAG: trypsin-like peptidase domain-containing protein [Bacilli bacterium]|nr:trypsin-like peptidase domain-containing protein [Bacilli bacterium]
MKKYFKLLLVIVLVIAVSFMSACSIERLSDNNNEKNSVTENVSYNINAKYGLDVNTVSSYDSIDSSDIATVVSNIVMPATVEITASIKYSYTYSYGGFIGFSSRTVNDSITSAGTAFFINSDGYLMTNAHVISLENEERYNNLTYTSREIKINFADSDVYFEVEIVAYDTNLDLAILKLKEGNTIDNLKYVTFFDMTSPESEDFNSDSAVKLYYGEAVVAIGNANGYGISVTQGVVSAPYRNFTSSGINTVAIQTDAAINEGNSGGPLANKYGAVIGINSFKTVTSTSESLGFAIPSYIVMSYIDSVNSAKGLNINYYKTQERAYKN